MRRLSLQEKIMFAKRLSILIRSGVSLHDAIQMLRKQPGSRAANKIFAKIAEDVERGQFLSTSLKGFRNVFGDFAVNVVNVGETSGTLEQNLNYLAEEFQKKQDLRRKVVGAMVYPAIVIATTIGLSVLLTVFLFPRLLPLFESFNFDLPFTTRALITVSSIFIQYGVYILAAVIAFAVAFTFLLRVRQFRYAIDVIILRIPLFGRIAQGYHMANFCRTLGLLLKSQVMVVEATRIAGNTVSNLVYQREIERVAQHVLKGERISVRLSKNSRIFPPLMTQMIAVGETTGSLSETLLYVSELYENEVDMLTKNLSTTLEPTLMIVVGSIVGFIAIAVITPIYEITQSIHI